MTSPWLVVGLGNPGERYASTRHNVGHLVVEELARRVGGRWRRHKTGRAEVVESPGVVLARPSTYMNETGGPVKALAGYHRVEAAHVVAVHDEIDLPLGSLRVKLGGGDNGHNGLRSLRASLGTGDFHRVRVGIGRPPGRQDPADFVLSDFRRHERPEVDLLVVTAADAVEHLLAHGLDSTQQSFNS